VVRHLARPTTQHNTQNNPKHQTTRKPNTKNNEAVFLKPDFYPAQAAGFLQVVEIIRG
jgi:hypothetical protein